MPKSHFRISYIIVILLISVLLIFLGFTKYQTKVPREVYQIYIDGEMEVYEYHKDGCNLITRYSNKPWWVERTEKYFTNDLYFYMKDGYNRVEVKGKEMFYMEAVVKDMNVVEDRTAMETLFSYLDKGIDDMEAGRLHTVDDAFQIIRDRMKNEL